MLQPLFQVGRNSLPLHGLLQLKDVLLLLSCSLKTTDTRRKAKALNPTELPWKGSGSFSHQFHLPQTISCPTV